VAELRRYCLCGSSMKGSASSGLAAVLITEFDRMHAGAGHGPATPGQASRARARVDILTIEEVPGEEPAPKPRRQHDPGALMEAK